jgi:methyl acetate hydrolase
VSDQSLEVYFKEKIFAPLGMSDTGFLISSAQKAAPHQYSAGKVTAR